MQHQNQMLDAVSQVLFKQQDLSLTELQAMLGLFSPKNLDLGEIYLQSHVSESMNLQDGRIRSSSFHQAKGAGLRALLGDQTGYAYCDELMPSALREGIQAALSIATSGQTQPQPLKLVSPPERHVLAAPLAGFRGEDQVTLLKELDALARSLDPRVHHVELSLSHSMQHCLILATDGTFVADLRPMVRFNIEIIAKQGDRSARGYAGGGGRYDLETLRQDQRLEGFVRKAVAQSLLNLDAKEAPAGLLTVVLGAGWPGVLLHEAVGHGLEADFNRKGTSVYSDAMGKRIASPGVTVVDDGTLFNRRGSLNVDDEGTPTQRNVLIEDGVLKQYLFDKQNAKLMKHPLTGNGRRESYAHPPMPRMTNTFMLPGRHTREEIIASVPDGIYAVEFGGGSVDITSGQFVFSATEAYRIRNGRIEEPLKGVTLIGTGADVMQRIDRIGDDLALDDGIGVCGKQGQSVPVGVGQPTLRINGMTVGGSQHG